MSRENVEALREVYERWARGDFWTPEIFDPKVQAVWTADIPDTDVTVGLDALAVSMKEWLAAWSEASMSAEDFREAGDSVVVAVRFNAKGRETDIAFEGRVGHLWTFRNGKAIRLEGYLELADALRAAGLSE